MLEKNVSLSEVAKEFTINFLKNRSYNRSAWNRGVNTYAETLIFNLYENNYTEFNSAAELKAAMLNGAETWKQYSYGGCALIYDGDIARTLCTPSELKRTDGGSLEPNSREIWLDVQARALYQAAARIVSAYITACDNMEEK